MIYDTVASQEQWSEALKKIRMCIQITKAIAASGGQGIQRDPGEVELDVMVPSPDRTKLIPTGSQRMTQDEFLRFLIGGEGLKAER